MTRCVRMVVASDFGETADIQQLKDWFQTYPEFDAEYYRSWRACSRDRTQILDLYRSWLETNRKGKGKSKGNKKAIGARW
jgi:hypothetical protein